MLYQLSYSRANRNLAASIDRSRKDGARGAMGFRHGDNLPIAPSGRHDCHPVPHHTHARLRARPRGTTGVRAALAPPRR
jgi:hypothetical protein